MSGRTIAGVAFAVVAAVVIGVVIYHFSAGSKDDQSGEIRAFESYSEIEKTIGAIEEEPMVYALGGMQNEDMAASGDSEAAKESHSDTYLQVDGVDEADIIKTDGEYIYYTSRMGYDVIIAKAKQGKTEDAAVITEEEMGIIADQIFLTDGRLIIIGNEYDDSGSDYDYYVPNSTMTSAVCIYDVSDPERPKAAGKYRQSGSYVSSRISGGYLYLITTDYLNTGGQRIVPMAGTGEDYDKLKPEQVYCFPEPSQRAYVVAGAVSIGDEEQIEYDTKAVLGASEGIYCSGSSIYFTDYRGWGAGPDPETADERTHIMKADISGGEIAFQKQGSVRGHVLNQFSMDEKDGYFRIATTAYVKGKDVNYLYILDDELEMTGKVKGFAAGEEIKAVRFIGDTAYVITYEQTDPLFVVDLKDPRAPEMLGSVEITGFSSLLLPEKEDMLIGIGSSTSEGEFGEMEDGLKIALFDISDPMHPEVLDSITYRDYSSDVQYDHKALTVSSAEGWYAIPYISWDDDQGGVLRFAVSDRTLQETGNYKSSHGIDRCLYIGEYLYGLETDEDEILSWKISEGEQ